MNSNRCRPIEAVGAQFGGAVLDREAVQSATADRDDAVIRIDGIGDAVHRIEKFFQHWITVAANAMPEILP